VGAIDAAALGPFLK